MQRRHFELIAETLKSVDTTGRYVDGIHPEALAVVVRAFADKLASTNLNFDRARFLRACGVEG